MEQRVLRSGELTRIVIGIVVASGEEGIDAPRLAAKLAESGISRTRHQCAVLLVGLAKAGRIERINRAVYGGA